MTESLASLASAVEKRDLRSVCWDVLGTLLLGEGGAAKFASPAASIMRVLLALGEESSERAQMLLETVVIGSGLHGLPPRTPEQWKLADRLYDEATLEDFRRWKPGDGWFGQPGDNVDFDSDWASDLAEIDTDVDDDQETDWRD